MSKYYNNYNFFDLDNDLSKSKSIFMIKNFKTMMQTQDNTCGPCCAIMALNYFNDERYTPKDELKVAKMMKTKPYPVGTNLPNFVNFFKSITDENHHYSIISSIDYPKNKNGLCFQHLKVLKHLLFQT